MSVCAALVGMEIFEKVNFMYHFVINFSTICIYNYVINTGADELSTCGAYPRRRRSTFFKNIGRNKENWL